MSITRIKSYGLSDGAVTTEKISAGVTLGGGVTIDQIIITDENFANTANTTIPDAGGYLKIYGSGFQTNANVYVSTNFSITSQVTANVISSNEIWLTIGSTTKNTPINLFLINQNASTATKLSAFSSEFVDSTHGWFAGSSPPSSSVDRIEFAADTNTASVRGPLSSTRSYFSATGNNNYGWFDGGLNYARIDFSDDTQTALSRGTTSFSRSSTGSTGNNNYGWFGGGASPAAAFSIVDRIDFAADTGTASVRGPLSFNRFQLTATGNDNFGWFGGGTEGAPGFSSTTNITRINFSDDTVTSSARGPLSTGRRLIDSTSNDDYGWFGGGFPTTSTVDRTTFANDTGTASVRGPLSSARYTLAATGSSNYGWFAGGIPGPVSRVDRVDFAVDTATASVRGPLSSTRRNLAATSGIA